MIVPCVRCATEFDDTVRYGDQAKDRPRYCSPACGRQAWVESARASPKSTGRMIYRVPISTIRARLLEDRGDRDLRDGVPS